MDKKNHFKNVFLLLSFLLLIGIAYGIAFFYPPSLSNLKSYYLLSKNFSDHYPIGAAICFMSFYALYSLLSLPGIFIFSIFAGFLFSTLLGTIYVTCAATLGASLLFLIARTTCGSFYYKKSSRLLIQMEKGFRHNAVSYLLFLRLFPLFPFFAVNLAGALSGVSFRTFIWTTFIGMIPSVWIYTEAGSGMAQLMEDSTSITPFHIINYKSAFILGGLALICLLPILIKKVYPKENGIPP